MFPFPPEERLLLARQRQAQLIREAEGQRLQAAGQRLQVAVGSSVARPGSRLLGSAIAALRSRWAAVWGYAPGRNAPCEEPCRDGAAGW
jgi:hypothetical protein